MVKKRIFDFVFAIIGLILLGWIVLLCVLIATIDTKSFGIFTQNRIGQFGKIFLIFKIKTVDDRLRTISRFGKFLRKSKLDELPQLINIIKGEMSVVGPRPDIPGYYDLLKGENRKILELKPGLTSEASIKYRDEEKLLQNVANPKQYNDEVIFPDKVKMNLDYYHNHNLLLDVKIIIKTIFA
jgi:lipopolysaccharide/colanic/teichoic acid biosynthesis glycosyltransferase